MEQIIDYYYVHHEGREKLQPLNGGVDLCEVSEVTCTVGPLRHFHVH
jgi:hypothetical protein